MIEGKDKLNRLFSSLRRRGYIARQRFLCCGGCASSQLAQDLKAEGNRDKVGAVYYHRQDAENLSEGFVYLGYGGRPDCDAEADRKVGMDILYFAAEAGLAVQWNGSERKRVRIILNKEGLPD